MVNSSTPILVTGSRPFDFLAREITRQRALVAQETPRGDYAPPAEVLDALTTIHIGVEEPGPNGGTQRIVHRHLGGSALQKIAGRVARKKAQTGR